MYLVPRVEAVSTSVVISQVYGGGGNTGAQYQNDFVELFNRGNSTVSLSGWSVGYASATGTGNFATTPISGSIAPGQYYLVKLGPNSAVGAPLPTADTTGSTGINMSGTAGKVVVATTTTLACNGSSTPCSAAQLAQIVDLVGYGNANFFEGAPAPTLSNTTAALRDNAGCGDTDNNSADFSAIAPDPVSPGAPNPRNTASATHPCGPVNQVIVPNCPTALNTTQGIATSAGVSATDPDGTVTNATITSASVAGITLNGFTPAASTGGTANATLNVANTTAPGTYNVVIRYSNNDSPTPQTATCTVVVTVNPPNQPINSNCPTPLTTTEGTATSEGVSATDPDGIVTSATITSAPVAGITLDNFTAAASNNTAATATLNVANTTAPGTYNVVIRYSNNDSPTPQTATCTVVVTVNPPPTPAAVVISQVYGGGGNTGSTLKNDYIEIINHSSAPVDLSGWSVQALATAGSTWSVTPLTNFILQPGQYYLIQESQGAGGTENLPTPDAIGTITVSSTSGKVALVSNTTTLTGTCPSVSGIVDFLGYGNTTDNTANCFEGSGPVPTLSNTSAAFRLNDGCFDSNDNAHDFVLGGPNPRNSSSPTNVCPGLSGIGSANPRSVVVGASTLLTVYAAPAQDPTSTGISVTADLSAIGGSVNQPFNGSGSTFTFNATVPANNAPGVKSLPVTIMDLQGRVAGTTISVKVLPLIPDHITISQLYGGGGNSGATYNHDYVELYNPHTTPFDLTGWSLQYGSATGDTWQVQPLGGTIAPGQYYLIGLATNNNAIGTPLPPANVSGDINMAQGSGKIALVSNFDALLGICPLGDPGIVDFVGYGSANCSEGSTAPLLNSSTADFRKDGGARDTDNNLADFVTGTPAPRQTAPIVEIGPSVFATDPRNGASSAPRDATLSISFTEPVTVDNGWYDINCVSTGNHNSATVRSFFGGDTYTITPNVNFLAGEQCTATIFKDAIHDVDNDDTGTNADSLPVNKVFTFTVATGTAPPYPASVHMTMGNPSGANIVDQNNYLMEKPELSLSYNRSRGTANWVSWHLSDDWIGTLARVDTFRADPAIPADWFRVSGFDYVGSGFDRGHMAPNADRDKETSTPINQATFLMTNMLPQSPDNNQGPWASLEGYLRTLLPGNEIYIVAGGAGTGGTGSAGAATTIAGGNVTVPAQTWKVALIIPKASGNDVSRVNCSTRTLAVIMPNVQGIRNDPWENYITTVDAVESLTGYDFFSNLPDAVENCVEAGTNGANLLATANQSASTQEDVPVEITLQAARPNTNPITFSIVSGPTKGSVGSIGAPSCTDYACSATVTYTPGLNYNGADSFTFKVSDGTHDSNTSTVSITVSSLNDNPDAVDDTPTIAEDSGANTINVLGNDTDTDGDSLTITAVTQGTNGSVAITNGGTDLSYTPAANFNGSDSFTYTIIDGNGGTDTATVSLTITAVNDAPVAADESYNTSEDAPLSVSVPGVLGNDSDVDGNTLTAIQVSSPSNGSLTLNSDGSFTYTPNQNFNGSDSFTYKANDAQADSNLATVTITVNPVNDDPTANTDAATVAEDSTNNAINVLANDSCAPDTGETLTVTAVSTPTHGTTAFTASGVTYTPAANYFGSDSFTYTVSDGHGGSDTATVNITVTNVNDAPVLTSSVAMNLISPPNSKLINVGLVANATDQEGESVMIQVAVFGDEDDQTATSPGEVNSPDAKDIAPNTLRLRAERVESNNGRVYLIVVTATDASGGVSRNYHTVVVPKSNSPANIVAAQAEAAAAASYAQSHGGTPPPGYFVIGDGPIIGPKQ
jgi:VCBS repeat-containing protein